MNKYKYQVLQEEQDLTKTVELIQSSTVEVKAKRRDSDEGCISHLNQDKAENLKYAAELNNMYRYWVIQKHVAIIQKTNCYKILKEAEERWNSRRFPIFLIRLWHFSQRHDKLTLGNLKDLLSKDFQATASQKLVSTKTCIQEIVPILKNFLVDMKMILPLTKLEPEKNAELRKKLAQESRVKIETKGEPGRRYRLSPEEIVNVFIKYANSLKD